jgi:predicted  nucleic acid-binding Zn-ribbon protein
MFVCTACGFLLEDVKSADQLPDKCPNCEATKSKIVEYDKRLESWVKKAVAQHVLYPDEEGADVKAVNSSLSSHIRFGIVGAVRAVTKK